MDLSVPSAKGAHGIKLLFQVLNAAFFSSDKLARAVATWAAVTGAEGVFPGLLAFWINDGRFGMFGRAGADIFGRVGRLGSVTFGSEGADILGRVGSYTFGREGADIFGRVGSYTFGREGADIFGRVGSYIFGRLGSVTFGREGTDMLGMAGSVTVGANVVLDPEVP